MVNSTIEIAAGIMSNDKPIYSEDTTIREIFNQNVASSSLNSGNNINIISKKNTNIQSSDLNSDNDVNIVTIDGNVNILASFNETTVKNTSKHKEISKTFIEVKGGSLSVDLKGEMSSGDVKNTTKTTVSSNINNNNVNIISGDNINIIASQDTFKASSKTENINENASVGNNAIQIGFDYGKDTSNANSVTNNSSYIGTNNGTINLNTDNNGINIKGANIEANNIDIDVANNLNLESLQDIYYNKSNSNNFGLNVGGNPSSINGGFNIGSSKGTIDNQWVNNQTSIIGNDKVDIKIGTKENSKGNTNIKGSLIVSGSYDNNGNFIDNNNLTLTTNTLTYEDIKDFYNNETKGSNFSISIGANKTDQNDINLHPQGTTTNKGEEKERITRATIGGGSILVKDKINGKDILINENNKSNQNTLLSDLNRDINKSQEITKNQITGALDGSMTIDNRLFTEGGRGGYWR